MEFIENSDANYTLREDKITALLQNIGRKYSVFLKLESLNLTWKIDRGAWGVGLFVGSTLVNSCDIRHRDIGATQLMLLSNLVGKMWKWTNKDINISNFTCDNPRAAYYLLLMETSLNRNGNNHFEIVDTIEVNETPSSFSFEIVERIPSDLSFDNNKMNVSSPIHINEFDTKKDTFDDRSTSHKDKRRILEDFVQTGFYSSDLFKSIPYTNTNAPPSTSTSSYMSQFNPFKSSHYDSYEETNHISDNSKYMVIFNELKQKGKIIMSVLSDTKSGSEHIPTFTVVVVITVKLNNGRMEEIVVTGSSLQKRNAVFEALYSFFNYNPIGVQLLKKP